MANNPLNVKCPKCGQELRVANPGKPGTFQVKCTHCEQTLTLQLKPQPLHMAMGPANSPAPKPGTTQVPLLTDVVSAANGKGYEVRTEVKTDMNYALTCPECGQHVLFKLSKPGKFGVKCRQCNAFFQVATEGTKQQAAAQQKPAAASQQPQRMAAAQPAAPADAEQQPAKKQKTQVNRKGNRYPGILTWGNIFNRKKFQLHEGSYMIGRKDDGAHSDIELKDDSVSRRSVLISVTRRENGYFFKLTVKQATNPVLLNNRQIAVGESIYLRYGDALQLGRTVINFNKLNK